MNFITAIDEGQAIIHSRGIYRQVPLYQRDGKIYAKHGGGFVRLSQGGATSAPNIRWAEIDTPHGTTEEKAGFVTYEPNAMREAAE